MKGKRRSIEEKVRILRKTDGEMTVLQVCDEYNISEQTFYRWKKELGLLEVKQAKRLKDLEAENKRLKKIVAFATGAQRTALRQAKAQAVPAFNDREAPDEGDFTPEQIPYKPGLT